MAEVIETVRIKHDEVPGGMVIEKKDFDPKIHELFEAEAADPKAARAKALTKMPADDVKELAKGHGAEVTTKAAAIEAVLKAEFPEAE
jgi:hypothetical protein